MKTCILTAAILSVAMTAAVQGAEVFYESFQATPGNQEGKTWSSYDGSAVWSSGFTGSQTPLTSSGDLTYGGLLPPAGNGKINVNNPTQVDRGYASTTGAFSITNGSAYHSFLLRVADFSGINTNWHASNWFISLNDSAAGYNCVGLRSNGNGGGYLMIARSKTDLANGPSDPECSAEIPLTAGNTYLVVLGAADVTVDNSSWKVWVNPSSLGGTAPAETSAGKCRNYNTAVRTIYIGNDVNSGGESVFTGVHVDELRVGTTYADVTPADAAPRGTLFLID